MQAVLLCCSLFYGNLLLTVGREKISVLHQTNHKCTVRGWGTISIFLSEKSLDISFFLHIVQLYN